MPLSDDEALARATSVYADYLAMVDTILGEGGRDPERIRQVASGQAADDFIRDAEEFTSRGSHTTGRTSFDSVKLQSSEPAVIRIYLCLDVSALDVVDKSGASTVSPTRRPRTPFVVGVQLPSALVDEEDAWTGDQFCAA